MISVGPTNLHFYGFIVNYIRNLVWFSLYSLTMQTYVAYRHKFHGSTIFIFRDNGESMIFCNGGTNLHLYGSVIHMY